MTASLDITVVVCTHNRASYLSTCVNSLLNQTLARERYEILIVDNASTDQTSAMCQEWERSGLIRCVYEPVPGLSQARNTGWKAASGRYVGYLDDDGKAEAGWLLSVLEAFEQKQPQPGWVGGPIDLDWAVPPPAWLDEELQECLGRLNWGNAARWLNPNERLGGGNSFYPRDVLERVGGFDTRLGRKKNLLLSGEETQLQRRMEALGFRLYYHPGVRMLHAVPPERLQPSFFQKRYYWGGITDELIRRSLAESGQPNVAPLPTAVAVGRSGLFATLGRIMCHTIAALGIASENRRIRGRIYWAYIVGRFVGAWRWCFDRELQSTARELANP